MKVITDAGTIDLGTTEAAPTIGIVDFSRRVTDDFGVTTVVERGFARRMSVRLVLPSDQVDSVQQQLAEMRATPARWIADERFEWLSFEGFYREFELDLALPPVSYCTLTVEGLTVSEPVADPGGDPAPDGRPSTLQLLRPVALTSAMLLSSNVPENDHPEWSAAVTYGLGAKVIKAAAHRVYESVAGGNVGNDPEGGSGLWVDIGPTNRWAMFDEALGTATSRSSSVAVTLDAGAVGAVALLDVVGATVRVQAPGYDKTVPVGPGAITLLDLPGVDDAVTITVAGSNVEIGTLLVGDVVPLGTTEANPSAGINDFSVKETDEFGDVTIVERAWSKRMRARAKIRTDAVDLVANRIAGVRAKPSLWIGNEGTDSLTIYGFFRDFSIEVGQTLSTLELSIEGLSKAPPPKPLAPINWTDIVDNDPVNRPRPDDGADVTGENTSRDTENVNGKPADQVISELDQLELDSAAHTSSIAAAEAQIADLFDTYGDTASAAASAAAAAMHADNAAIAAGNAEQAEQDAADAREAAGLARDAAQQAKADAESAEAAAIAAASAAAGSSSTAAGHATTATTKANEAAGSATAAAGSATTATTKAGEASVSAGQAASSATTAEGHKNAAASSATVAANARDAAQGHASAASSSASTAGTHASDAASSASAANTAKTQAETARSQAQTFASNASNSATDAAGSASSAESSATVAASAMTSAERAAQAIQPTTFEDGALYFKGDLAIAQPNNATYVVDPTHGPAVQVLNAATYTAVAWKRRLPNVAGKRWKVRALVAHTSGPTGTVELRTEHWPSAEGGTRSSATQAPVPLSSTTPVWIEAEVDGVTSPFINPEVILNYPIHQDHLTKQRCYAIELIDITESHEAGLAAIAAATSASSAAASESSAASSASAASSSATTASTAAGQAQTYAGQASTSASTAEGHANTASSQASVSASSAEAAQSAAQAIQPTTFEDGALYFKGDQAGPQPNNATYVVDPTHGPAVQVLNAATYTAVAWKRRLPSVAGKRWRIRARLAHQSGPPVTSHLRLEWWSSARGGTRSDFSLADVQTSTSVPGWFSAEFTAGAHAFVNPEIVLNYPTPTSIVRCYALELEDITESYNSQQSASAAATSASLASTKATEASTSASAASTSATNAATSAGSASTHASNSSTSASNAASSASAASSSATAANISAGNAATSASTASSSASVATSQAAAAQISATLAAKIAGGGLVKNGTFSDYPTSPQVPPDWLFAGGAQPAKVTGQIGPNAVRLIGGAGAEGARIYQDIGGPAQSTARPGQWWVLEAQVTLVSGSFVGAGALLQGMTSSATGSGGLKYLTFATDKDSTGAVIGAGSTGKTYRFSKLIQINDATVHYLRVQAFAHYSGAGSIAAANSIDFHLVGVRPATAAEIRDQTVLGPLEATVSTQASALATLNSQYASLNDTVGVQGVTITNHTSALATHAGNISTLFGRAGVKVDVGGRVTGWETNNNGQTGDFKIHADHFSVEKPGGGDGLTWTTDSSGRGTLRVKSGVVNVIEIGWAP